MAKKKEQKVEAKCKNCLLYNPDKETPGWGVCGVAILHSGKQIHIPMEHEANCFFEEEYVFRSKFNHNKKEVWKPDVQNVKWWEEDGKVKIEYPEGFFGKEDVTEPEKKSKN